jgi:hypothetical protein
MSPRSTLESAYAPVQGGEKLRKGWLRSPKLTGTVGVAAALSLCAWGWAGHARLTDSDASTAPLPSAAETLATIETADYDEAADEAGTVEPIEYRSPDEVPEPPAEEAVGAAYLSDQQEVPSEEPMPTSPVDEGVDGATIPVEPLTEGVVESAVEAAPEASTPAVPAPVDPAPESALTAEESEPADQPVTELPAAESIPDLPAETPLRELAAGEEPPAKEQVELQRVDPAAPEKPAVALPTADLCRKYAPKSIGQLRLSVQPDKAGALPADKGDPAAACFPQGSEYAGTDTWYETSCYGKYLFICHDPLYFEDQVAERYGEHWGKWVQPAVSAGKFFGAVPMAPYRFFANTLSEECYSQDKYGQTRNGFADGTFVPPFHAGAAAMTAGAVTGLYFLVP